MVGSATGAIREELLSAFGVALDAVDPVSAVRRALKRRDRTVLTGGAEFAVSGVVRLVAVGKAAVGMALGAYEALDDLIGEGLVVSATSAEGPPGMVMLTGAHPRPDESSLRAGGAAIDMAKRSSDKDLLLCLISGGGSALIEQPRRGLDLADLVKVQDALVEAGAPIHEMNLVRRHLSLVKNGGLAAEAGGAVLTLLISDVAGAPPSSIASGPTISDDTTPSDAREVLRRRLGERVWPSIVAALGSGVPTRYLADNHWEVVADGSMAGRAAAASLDRHGIPARVVDAQLSGEAADRGRQLVTEGQSGVSVLTGETTVAGSGSGKGGRNQEAALAAALAGAGEPGWVFAALGTDGVDGPTDATGAIVDGGSVSRGNAAGRDAADALRSHNSYDFLEASGDLVRTGPTGTNVGDIWILVRDRETTKYPADRQRRGPGDTR